MTEPALYVAIPLWQAAVLGAIQGLGEFLPISSSAHLILAPWFFGWRDPGLTFDVALHLGTLIAVLLFFGRDWLRLIGAALRPAQSPGRAHLFWYLVAASVPGAIMGLLLEKKAEHALRHPLILAGTLAAMGLILWWADRTARSTRRLESLSLPEAVSIGIAQGFAVIPGVSRAGVTMSAARGLGLTREDAARFSFLLSTPIIAGAAAVKMRHMLHEPPHPDLIVGTLVAAVVGIASIRFLLDFLKRHTFTPFVIYRLLLAVTIVAWFFTGHPATP